MESYTVRKIKDLKPLVREILYKFPEARDNDRILVLKVWAYQVPELRQKGLLFNDFAVAFIKGEFYESKTIERTRRTVQRIYPETRGLKYAERHAEAEAVRTEIND